MFNNYRYRKVIDPYNVMVFDREKHMGWKKIHDIIIMTRYRLVFTATSIMQNMQRQPWYADSVQSVS